jgi:putative flippase GtrA
VDLAPRALIDQARSPTGQKFLKYSAVSVVSVIIAQVLFIVAFNVFRWTGTQSNMFAVGVSAVPSYYLNRAWAWGKRGRSHLVKEVLPFWGLAFLGLAGSTWAVSIAHHHVHHTSRAFQTLVVNAANLGAFGALWIAKFIIFNELMFKHHPEVLEDEPALDGRAGIPG